MVKYSAFVLAVLTLFSNCFGDTFTHRQTGESFNGYVVQRKKGNKTQVRAENKKPQYLDLSDYEISYNHLGRKNKVFVFSITDSIELICETEAFEKAIVTAANQGPLFILIEIDTPGGRIDLTKRICAAITKTDNCRTVAFVSGGKNGGAFSAGAIIALACDYLSMANDAAIGAATAIAVTSGGVTDLKSAYGETVGEKFNSAWQGYCSAIAERNDRPGLLVKAMIDKDIEVMEVVENDRHFFVSSENKKPSQSVVRRWSEKGSLLTLTAAEAEQCGIADGLAASREALLAELDAAKAVHIRDRKALKARRMFEKAKREFDKILSNINHLEKQANALAKELKALDKTIIKDSKASHDSRGRVTEEYNPLAIRKYLYLKEQWPKVVKALEQDYKEALYRAKKHSDLSGHVKSLEEGLKWCKNNM